MIIDIDATDTQRADTIARMRLSDQSRWHSQHRTTSRNIAAQLRGALGEIAAVKWLRREGFAVTAGFEDDHPTQADLTVNGVRIEVMTAQIAHRNVTGFCVPPNKLWAARRRDAIGYLFVGTDGSARPSQVVIQSGVRIDYVDAEPPRETYVNPKFPVVNFVINNSDLLTPEALLQLIREESQARGR